MGGTQSGIYRWIVREDFLTMKMCINQKEDAREPHEKHEQKIIF
jgi:hypothetical protein